MDYIQSYGDRFEYFNRCLGFPDWTSLTVLDFGGNWGNLLRDPKSKILPQNYSCIDVSRKAIELGQRDFPEANWYYYNRWNPRFNPDGIKNEKIPFLGNFDIILACSVFTHTTEIDMIETISILRKWCKRIAFTIMTPDVAAYYAKKRNPNYDEEALGKKIKGLEYFYLINDNQVFLDDPNLIKAHSFYYIASLPYIQDLFPGVQVHAPVGSEIQHCCILNGEIS